MTAFLHQHASEISRLTFEHLWLTLFAMLLASAIGVPTGILLTRYERLAKPVIAFANIIQVIPSLALFGLLLPVPWLGENAARLAILALTGYALLPIIRNTYAGIRSIDPSSHRRRQCHGHDLHPAPLQSRAAPWAPPSSSPASAQPPSPASA